MNLILKRSLLIGTILFAFSFPDTAIAADSEPLAGWHLVDGQEKYFENDQIVTGLRKISSTTYLFNSNGIKQTGWHQLNGKDYYFDPNSNGGMITGKRKIGKTTYLLHNNGYKVYGWHQLNGKDYYFDPNYGGGMVTGKRKIGKTTYLMHNDGHKTYGWHQLAGKDYYFDRNYGGGMVTGKRKIGNTTYLLHNNGYKIYGWSRLKGKDYYFDPNYGGGMITGERRVDNSVYLFNSDGSKNKYLKPATNANPEQESGYTSRVNAVLAKTDAQAYNLAYNMEWEAAEEYQNLSSTEMKILADAIDYDKLNTEFGKLINRHRASLGLNQLTHADDFVEGTHQIAKELADYGYIAPDGMPGHTLPNGESTGSVFSEDLQYLGIGENLAFRYNENNPYQIVSEKYLAEEFFSQWMNSAGHKANMETEFFTEFTLAVQPVVNGNTKAGTRDEAGNHVITGDAGYFSGVGIVAVLTLVVGY